MSRHTPEKERAALRSALIDESEANSKLRRINGELLEACKQTWHYIHSLKRPGEDRDNPSYTVNIVESVLLAAIAKADGK